MGTQVKLSDGDNSHNLNGCSFANCGAQRTTRLLETMSSSATWTLVSGLAQCQLARPSVLLLILLLTLVASPPHQLKRAMLNHQRRKRKNWPRPARRATPTPVPSSTS